MENRGFSKDHTKTDGKRDGHDGSTMSSSFSLPQIPLRSLICGPMTFGSLSRRHCRRNISPPHTISLVVDSYRAWSPHEALDCYLCLLYTSCPCYIYICVCYICFLAYSRLLCLCPCDIWSVLVISMLAMFAPLSHASLKIWLMR